MDESTILKCIFTNGVLALIAIEIEQARPIRISYTRSWWWLLYISWIVGSIIAVPAVFAYFYYLGA